MKVQNNLVENTKQTYNRTEKQPKYSTPNFKGGSAILGLMGSAMQSVENGGFLTSFLIQDALGMTAPRVGAAFLRDKEITGQYNIQEGFEVLGREGLTGPCMMAVAPIMFALAAKFGKTTGVNSQLIRRFGNNFKEIVSNPKFDKALLNDKDAFQKEFFRVNIKEMLHNTLGINNVKEDSINIILEKLQKMKDCKGKTRKQLQNEITKYINDLKLSSSDELDMLDKVKIGSEKLNNIKPFSTADAIQGMIKYSDDAIILNKHLATLNEAMAEDIKNSALAKRFITNIATMASTLGVLSVLPKLYAKSDIAPGAKTAMIMKEQAAQAAQEEQNKTPNENISFKGKGKPSKFLSKIGKWLQEHSSKTEKFASELEYNGHNFTNTLMAGLSLFGLLAPRGMRAYNRAQIDEKTGKKDLTELYEILIRDISSSLSVVFLVPMLTRMAVTAYEGKSGFVLMHKDRTKQGWKTALDLINPYSSAHVLKNSEIHSLYNNIDSLPKMLNFCEYIDKNGGDLHKILAKSEKADIIFKNEAFNLAEFNKLDKAAKNTKIKDFIKDLGKNGRDKADDVIKELMKGSKGPKGNKILSFARGLNSVPGLITTFIISPCVLGWLIPNATYANTRRIHAKQQKERQEADAKINTAV